MIVLRHNQVCYIIVILTLCISKLDASEVKRLITSVQKDSINISFWLYVDKYKTSGSKSFTFTPVLRARDYIHELPSILISGTRRYNFDRREAHLSKNAKQIMPYISIIGKKAHNIDSIYYSLSIPYTSQMDSVSLLLMKESRDCCVFNLIGIDTLANNLKNQSKKNNKILNTPCTPCIPCIPMVSYLPPKIETVKKRTKNTELHIDYPVNKFEVYTDFMNNEKELIKLDSLMPSNDLAMLRSVYIHGYASPEGPYEHNKMLASKRSMKFAEYMINKYDIPESCFKTEWTPEDWKGLIKILEDERPYYYKEVTDIIKRYSIFEGREDKLKKIEGGIVFKLLKEHQLMFLRRISVRIDYDVRDVTTEESAKILHSDPSLLSIQEMYRLAWIYGPGTDDYCKVYEIAAKLYPNDPVININASSAVIMSGDFKRAHQYIDHLKDDIRAWNNLGVLAMMEGKNKEAEFWFRKALKVEPQKALENLAKLMDQE